MTAITLAFLATGGFALLLLLLSLVGGGHLHLHLGHVHLGHFHLGHSNGGADLSLPVLAGFLGAFGFGGAIGAQLTGPHGTLTLLVACLVGLVAAVPTAWLAGKFVHAAMNMATDATLTSADLVGISGVVITPVPSGGYGEVRLAVAGQQMKFNARADRPLALGTRVFVISVPSPTSVLVEETPRVQ
jgi:membrane protein implicated in regulation of membrane protease activity